ncbi:hypothetical protein ACHWQZ_G017135 [Mnemiopsis leidyi]
MNVGRNEDSNIKTVRIDAKCLAGIAIVSPIGDFNVFPEDKVSPSFRNALQKLESNYDSDNTVAPHEEFVKKVGVFYATDIQLGGRINKSYTMQATEEDTELSVKAELEASYGIGCWGVTGSSNSSYVQRTSNKNATMKAEWRSQGGNTKLWLGCSFGTGSKDINDVKSDDESDTESDDKSDDKSDAKIDAKNDAQSDDKSGAESKEKSDAKNAAEHVAQLWADSVNISNAYPINMTLKPIWELVRSCGHKKLASELETYLTNKWSTDAGEFNPKQFLEVEPKISKHKNSAKMLVKINEHIDWLKKERADAQGWFEVWHAVFDKRRNSYWRAACDKDMKIINKIKDKITSDMTVDQFKALLHNKKKDSEGDSKRRRGCCERDSARSNQVHDGTKHCIEEIEKLC